MCQRRRFSTRCIWRQPCKSALIIKSVAPQLEELYNSSTLVTPTGSEVFAPQYCESPLPRAYQWADGQVQRNHAELVQGSWCWKCQKALGWPAHVSRWLRRLYRATWTTLNLPATSGGSISRVKVAAVTGDVPMGASAKQAHDAIRLLMLVNDVSLRGLIPAEFASALVSSSLSRLQRSPVASYTRWARWTVEREKRCTRHWLQPTTIRLCCPNAGVDMTFTRGADCPCCEEFVHCRLVRSLLWHGIE